MTISEQILAKKSHTEDVEIKDVPAVTDSSHEPQELIEAGYSRQRHILQMICLEKGLHLPDVPLHDLCHVTLSGFRRQEELPLKMGKVQ